MKEKLRFLLLQSREFNTIKNALSDMKEKFKVFYTRAGYL